MVKTLTNYTILILGQYGHGRTIDTGKPYRISHAQVIKVTFIIMIMIIMFTMMTMFIITQIMNGELMSTSSHHFSQEGR